MVKRASVSFECPTNPDCYGWHVLGTGHEEIEEKQNQARYRDRKKPGVKKKTTVTLEEYLENDPVFNQVK